MLCSQLQLVKTFDDHEEIKLLPCNSWNCEYCAPRRRRRLIATAASGEPTSFLTLTVNVAIGESPLHRRNLLHDAWKRLVKRILRQFAIDAEKRWQLKTKHRSPKNTAILRAITTKTPRLAITRLPYMAFTEKTQIGEPHLHILLRAPYIPQDWISEQMLDMLGSPIVDIRKIRNTKAAVSYVTKYVTKAPAQFGNTKRYWISKGWEVNTPDDNKEKPISDRRITVRLIRYDEWLDGVLRHADILVNAADGWVRVYPARTPWDVWGAQTEPIDA